MEVHPEQALDERAVADLVAEAEEGGRDLRVADGLPVDPEAVREQREVTLRGVRDRHDRGVGDEREHGLRVGGQRVDRRDLERAVGGAGRPPDLYEAELGDVAPLGHELEVEGEGAGRADALGDGLDLVVGGGERAIHRALRLEALCRGAHYHGAAGTTVGAGTALAAGALRRSIRAVAPPRIDRCEGTCFVHSETHSETQAGTYVRTASRELAVRDGPEELPAAGWQPLTARTDLGRVEARALLVERGLVDAAGARAYYWRMPPSVAQASSLFKLRTEADDDSDGAADAPRPGDLPAPAETS